MNSKSAEQIGLSFGQQTQNQLTQLSQFCKQTETFLNCVLDILTVRNYPFFYVNKQLTRF